jgi:GT2 family glycosyltransferase
MTSGLSSGGARARVARRDDDVTVGLLMVHAGTRFVSVIVPVLDNAAELGRCVDALSAQSYPRDRYEIIVVDNGSSPEQLSAVAAACEGRAAMLVEPRPGSYAARNRGLTHARGEIFAFTDSDCVPAKDWLAAGTAHFDLAQHVGLVAGPVTLYGRNREAPNIFEEFDALVHLRQAFYVQRGFAATANLFAMKEVFEDVGPFDASLLSGGDTEWGLRASARGWRFRFAPGAIVEHEARDSWASVARKVRRTMGGMYAISSSSQQSIVDLLQRERRMLTAQVRLARQAMTSHRRRAGLVGLCFAVSVSRLAEIIRLRAGGTPRRT